MNIYDVYITKVYTVDNIEYQPHFIVERYAKYTRTTIVLRKEKYGSVKYYDLLANRYIKHNLACCNLGDEVIGIKKMYVSLAKHIDYHGPKNVCKRKVKSLIKNKALEDSK
ncbi:MAG: hypothetical protein IJ715_01695 [Bacilli bacterium]|nr:hypothetical protein [Bacilli bacterium]